MKFWFGALAGATLAVYIAFRESPPSHIESWRLGMEGERRTAKALRHLLRQGWLVRHDLAGGGAANVDHVVVGPPGVFLLDTKNFSGEGSIEDGEFMARWLEDPDEGWTSRSIGSRAKAASAELSERIADAAGVRVWVQPVVVLWMRFPQRVVDASGVFFVHGDALAQWLLGRQESTRPFDPNRVVPFLTTAPRA